MKQKSSSKNQHVLPGTRCCEAQRVAVALETADSAVDPFLARHLFEHRSLTEYAIERRVRQSQFAHHGVEAVCAVVAVDDNDSGHSTPARVGLDNVVRQLPETRHVSTDRVVHDHVVEGMREVAIDDHDLVLARNACQISCRDDRSIVRDYAQKRITRRQRRLVNRRETEPVQGGNPLLDAGTSEVFGRLAEQPVSQSERINALQFVVRER